MRTAFMWAALCATAALAGPLVDVIAAESSGVKPPRKIKDVKPEYPADSLTAGDEGVVIVELRVDASGAVEDVTVVWSKCARLNEAALTAARAWRYETVLVNGVPTAFTVTTQVPFRLPDKLKSRVERPGACRWIDPPKPIQ